MVFRDAAIVLTFSIFQWLGTNASSAKYNIANSYPTPLSVKDLQSLSDDQSDTNCGPLSSSVLSARLGYGELPGLKKLRTRIASLYSVKTPTPLPADNVLVTSGGSLANCLVFYALCGPGDHVIVQYPTYQLSHSVPASLGADVSLWKAKEQHKWHLDVDALQELIKPNTKMIVLTYVGETAAKYSWQSAMVSVAA